ncbi:hypothetical protein [Oceanivirga salmonicida]|uniref:hypothetical protein n=1 Tax=Oceanivirga salmonicida TaxID=1769291 RepID=UPI00082DE196|nr:hypothetical protein [Oceanivirga salmonicida]
MKKLKYIIPLILITLITSTYYTIKYNITEITNFVVKDLVKLNIDAGKIELNGFNIDLNDVVVNELDGTKVGTIKKATLRFNPLLITRIGSVDVYGANFDIIQNKDGKFNVDNILPKTNIKRKKRRNSNLGNVYLHDSKIRYISKKFDKEIEEIVENVNGKINLLSGIGYDINVEGLTKNGVIGVRLRKENKYLKLNFKDYKARDEFLQYVPIDFIKSGLATLNGTLEIYKKNQENKIKSDLDISVDSAYYKDFDKEIKDINAKLVVKDKKIDIIADARVDNKPVKLTLNTVLNDNMKLKLDIEDISFYTLKKYKLLDKINVDIDGNVSGSIDTLFTFKDKKIKLEKYNLDIKSDSLNVFGNDLKDVKLTLDEKNILLTSKLDDIEIKLKSNEYDIEKQMVKLHIDATNVPVVEEINADIEYNDKKIFAKLSNNDNSISINGTTDANSNHDYDIVAKLKEYGNINAKVVGKSDKIDVEFKTNSEYFYKVVDIHNLQTEGVIKDILGERKLNAKVQADEVWLNYQRLVNVKADIEYADNKININNIKNEFLDATARYDLDDKLIYFDAKLKNYMLYTTSKKLDINVMASNLALSGSTDLKNINATGTLKNSDIYLDGKKIGVIKSDVLIENENLKLNAILNESKLLVNYNIKAKYLDAKMVIDQELSKIKKFDELNAVLKSDINIKGKLDNLYGDMTLRLKNIKYNNKSMPEFSIKSKFKDIDILEENKKGKIDIEKFQLIKDGKSIYSTNLYIDLENLNMNLDLDSKNVDLSQFSPDLLGNVELNAYLRGNLKDYFGEVIINSREINILENKFKNLALSIQVNNKGINIGQGYVEYEKNPLIVDGYLLYTPLDYNFKVLAKDFDLGFLKLNKNVKEASGIADVDLIASNGNVKGDIKLNNLRLLTTDIDIERANIDIGLLNKNVKINEFSTNLNGGRIELTGNFMFPVLDENFINNKKLKLNDFNLKLMSRNVVLKNNKNNVKFNTSLTLNEKKLLGKVEILGGYLNDINAFETKNKNKKSNYFVTIIQEIVYNIMREYKVKVDLNIKKPILVDIPNYILIKDIGGKVVGNLDIEYYRNKAYVNGILNVDNGSFDFNKNHFRVDRLKVEFDRTDVKLNPSIDLKAATNINNENIELSINSKLSDIFINFKSENSRSREEIINLLTLNGKNIDSGKDAFNFAAKTAINQLVSTFTNPIAQKLGFTKFEINAGGLNGKEFTIGNLRNASANFYLQGLIYKNIYWNLKTNIPFDTRNNAIDYDIGLSYDIKENVNANFGVKLDSKVKGIKDIDFYTGVSFKRKFNHISDIFNRKGKK